MTTEQAIKYIKLDEGRRVTAEESISILGRMMDEFCNEDSWMQECKDAVDMAIEALKEQSETSTEIQEILNYLDTTLHPIVSPDNWYVYAELHDMVSMLPSAQPEHSPNTPQKQPDLETLGIKTEKTCEDVISRQAAIDEIRRCRFVVDAIEKISKLPSAQPERTCVNCGRTANNGGWYADGRTRCPIEEHYALPKDGYCHLWEKRNVTDDDYPERREDG